MQLREPALRVAFMPPKPTLQALLLDHHLQFPELARESHQDPMIIWGMILGYPVDLDSAIQVLQTFNDLRGTQYRLRHITIALEDNESQL